VKTIGVVTVARSDYGIYLPVLQKIQADPELKLQLIVAGMHLSPEFGLTVQTIEADGFEVSDRVEMLLSSDSPEAVSKSMGMGTIGFAQVFGRSRPDVLLVLGDRFEMHSAAIAALPFKMPVAHIHGGELTEGAIDNAMRHSMTHLSHIHFVTTEESRVRVMQLGEEESRVVLSGAPSLDNLHLTKLLGKEELEAQFGWSLTAPPLLVTYHPVTLEFEQTEWQVKELLAALEDCDRPLIFTGSNADTGGRIVGDLVREFADGRSQTWLVDNLGTTRYFSLMACAAAMVGNSSSGIIEAPSFGLPVVNIGSRQQGRTRGANVIDVGYRPGPDRQTLR
jgi:UDP-hydrolysing UDP-N-acetyl-D-glucosamine 2-epimerase